MQEVGEEQGSAAHGSLVVVRKSRGEAQMEEVCGLFVVVVDCEPFRFRVFFFS